MYVTYDIGNPVISENFFRILVETGKLPPEHCEE
jgi:hypothetical protein